MRIDGLQARDLTDDFTGLSNALAGMQPVGWTNISLAAEMGWHMLSPNEPFETARDYTDPYLRKIMILLTDGVQTIEAMGPTGDDLDRRRQPHDGGALRERQGDDISVFTIAYDVDDTAVYDLLSGCASDRAPISRCTIPPASAPSSTRSTTRSPSRPGSAASGASLAEIGTAAAAAHW